jgi:DNA-binding NarL/FixJ family response regulator
MCYLADSVVVSIRRSVEDRSARSELGIEDDRDLTWDPTTSLAHRFGQSLHEIRECTADILLKARADGSSLVPELDRLHELCERVPTELSELTLAPTSAQRAWDSLTDQQRKVARLIARSLTNQEIADELGIELTTVKKHVTAVLRAFEVTQRLGVHQRLQGMNV